MMALLFRPLQQPSKGTQVELPHAPRQRARRCNRRVGERGFVLVLVALSALGLLTVLALTLGVASWYLDATRLQRTVDAAALAGATALPDVAEAEQLVNSSLASSGVVSTVRYAVTTNVTNTGVQVAVRLKQPSASFLPALSPKISIVRKAVAIRQNARPIMGSPFNVLGTGDLQVGNLPKQNFWLALSGRCQPREDGDYFNAFFINNRGPYLNPSSAGYETHGGYKEASGARTHCSTQFASKSPTYSSNGYSYLVDIPKPPGNSGYLDIGLFDPAFKIDGPPFWEPSIAHDTDSKAAADYWPHTEPVFTVWDTNNTPDDFSDDTSIPGCPMRAFADGYFDGNARARGRDTPKDWHMLCRVPYDRIVKTVTGPDGMPQQTGGNTIRVQVQDPIQPEFKDYNIPDSNLHAAESAAGHNGYAIGAFASWIPEAGCDSRTNLFCPRMYTQSSISVMTVEKKGNAVTPMYFAQVGPSAAGSTIKLYLWDPGENVNRIELWGPGSTPIPNAPSDGSNPVPTGTQLNFSWTEVNGQGMQVGGVNAGNFIDTSGKKAPSEFNAWTSNDYRYNDRLLIIDLVVPNDWAAMIAQDPNLSEWLRLVYHTNGAYPDRTTWGFGGVGGVSSPPRLVQ